MTPSPHLIRHANRALDGLMAQVDGATAAVIATIDGFDVASRVRSSDGAARLAAMASSISAICSVVCDESQVGAYQSISIESGGGYVVMVQIAHPDGPLILNLVASKKAVLAQMAYFARLAATQVGEAEASLA